MHHLEAMLGAPLPAADDEPAPRWTLPAAKVGASGFKAKDKAMDKFLVAKNKQVGAMMMPKKGAAARGGVGPSALDEAPPPVRAEEYSEA